MSYRRLQRYCVGVLAGLGLTVVVVTVTPLTRWWASELSGRWQPLRGDTLVVLAGSALDPETIGESTYLRCVYAARAYRRGGIKTVVLSGGGVPKSRAETMREFLTAQGVPYGRIRLEQNSRSTHENALMTAKLLRGRSGRVVVLTSDYHMYRALRCFRRAGLDAVGHPVPDVMKRASSPWKRWDAFMNLLLETVKIVYYGLMGRL